mmetsp:Transcript_33976/g.39216  ORF Transcript_33976/g.39216 Transcript_33976/m.39216 type:complete len:196 (-) Transcript_33976:281-868(-)
MDYLYSVYSYFSGAKFDAVQFKTLCIEGPARMRRKTMKKRNQLAADQNKIVGLMGEGRTDSALECIETYMNDECKFRAYETLSIICEQLREQTKRVENFGVAPDIEENVLTLIYSSTRLDVEELKGIADMIRPKLTADQVKKLDDPSYVNQEVKEDIAYSKIPDGVKYLKLIEFCAAKHVACELNEAQKQVLRTY